MPEVKEVKLSLGDLKMKEAAIAKLLTCELLSVKTSYRMSKFSKAVIKELSDLKEEEVKLAKKYGEEKGENIVIKPENKEAWLTDLKALLDEEVSFSLVPINLKELMDVAEQLKKHEDGKDKFLAPVDIMHLEPFIIEDENG